MKRFTTARIIALMLIGLAFLSLGYLKVATADDPVSFPKGALAGDLLLDPCTYSTEDGSYAADCGTLVVPENRADPQSRLIAVQVTRIRAKRTSLPSPSSASKAVPARPTWTSAWRADSPLSVTSCSSGTEASTARFASTARRSSLP